MGDAELTGEVTLRSEQLEDFARLLAKCLGRGNIDWLANLAMGPEAVQQAGNEVADVKAFALKVVQALQEHNRISYAVDLLLREGNTNGLLALGLRHLLSGKRLDSDQALQAFVNDNEPFLSSADMIELIPKITRRVCAVALGPPINKIVGSGFLVAPDAVMTNYHVVEPFLKVNPLTQAIEQDKPGNQIFFFFDYLKAPAPNVPPAKGHNSIVVTAADQWLLQAREKLADDGTAKSPREIKNEFDYAVIKLQRPVGALSSRPGGGVIRGWLTPEDEIDVMSVGKRVIVFQHPEAAPQQFDIGDYVQMDPSSTRVWYSVSTAHGSSGGAAVGVDGRLFALHNAEVQMSVPAAGGRRVNQGVRIDRIAKDLPAAIRYVAVPEDDDSLLWSLNDDFRNSRPIIGRAQFRDMVTQMQKTDAERVLVVTGTPPVGLQFSVKLLRRMLGTHVPVVVFSPNDLQKLTPPDFLQVLANEFNISAGRKMPELLSTEAEPRWVRTDLPQWLVEGLSRDQELNKTKYPAWVVINAVLPEGQRLFWGKHLKDFIAALLGVHDKGQPAVDVPYLRWLFLATTANNLPLDGVNRLEENLDSNSAYERDFEECYQHAYRSIDKEGSFPPGSLQPMAGVALDHNEAQPPDKKLAPRKALSEYVRLLLKRAPQAGVGD